MKLTLLEYLCKYPENFYYYETISTTEKIDINSSYIALDSKSTNFLDFKIPLYLNFNPISYTNIYNKIEYRCYLMEHEDNSEDMLMENFSDISYAYVEWLYYPEYDYNWEFEAYYHYFNHTYTKKYNEWSNNPIIKLITRIKKLYNLKNV